jgi:hypothetical protein
VSLLLRNSFLSHWLRSTCTPSFGSSLFSVEYPKKSKLLCELVSLLALRLARERLRSNRCIWARSPNANLFRYDFAQICHDFCYDYDLKNHSVLPTLLRRYDFQGGSPIHFVQGSMLSLRNPDSESGFDGSRFKVFAFWSLGFGASLEFGAWNLELYIACCDLRPTMLRPMLRPQPQKSLGFTDIVATLRPPRGIPAFRSAFCDLWSSASLR